MAQTICIAVGGSSGTTGNMAYSTDEVSWTGNTSGNSLLENSDYCSGIAYNGLPTSNGTGLWVVANGSTINTNIRYKLGYSRDGVSWTGSTSGGIAFTGGQALCVAHNGLAGSSGLWVAGGTIYNKIAYSTDGVSWTGSTSGRTVFGSGNETSCNTVCHNKLTGSDGLWVAGASNNVGPTSVLAYSTNGVSWTGSTSGNIAFIGGFVTTVAYNNRPVGNGGLWYAAGVGVFNLAYSTDGVSWTGSTSGLAALTGKKCLSVCHNGLTGPNALWIAGAETGVDGQIMAVSNDGISWTGCTSGDEALTGGAIWSLAFDSNGKWVAGGSSTCANQIATSTDGLTWIGSTSGNSVMSTGVYAVAFGPTVCVLRDTPICVSEFNGVQTYKKIQDLREGDYIIGAISNTPKKIVTVVSSTHKYAEIDPTNVPYKIPADFYAKHLPVQDIYISGTHAIVLTNSKKEPILVSVSHTKKFVPATADELSAFGYPDITYYNIELEQADGMYVGGVPVETLTLRTSLNL